MIVQKKKIIPWCMLIIWMIFIFVMSNTPSVESSKQSEFVLKVFSVIGIDINSYLGDLATLVIRKAGHVTEYFILFILLYRVDKLYNNMKYNKIWLVGIVFIYACTDEIHQYFIPGRAARFTDVMIDTSGAIIASIIILVIVRVRKKYKKKAHYQE